MKFPPPLDVSALAAVQGAMTMLSQVLLAGGDIDPVAWLELSQAEQLLALGVVLGATSGLARQLETVDPGFSTARWLAGVAAEVTAAVST